MSDAIFKHHLRREFKGVNNSTNTHKVDRATLSREMIALSQEDIEMLCNRVNKVVYTLISDLRILL